MLLRMINAIILMLLITGLSIAQEVPSARTHGPSPEVQPFQNVEKVEIYRLRIVNDENGEIAGSRNGGTTWEVIGRVLGYTAKVSQEGYTASKWAPMSAVAATAVNAIHIRTGYNSKADKGVVFSILPKEMLTEQGRKLQSFYSADASIYTDIPGGTGLFGGGWAPILGNPVSLLKDNTLTPLPENYTPKKGDVFVIQVMQPKNTPFALEFENRFGGFITVVGWDGSRTEIGQVLKPVAGVGRFTGSQYAAVGRLRANHNGVIDVSTSTLGAIAGFQIIPREHAMSPEMVRARTMTQWMVVGPLDARDPSWEGVAPLFFGYLHPSYREDDWDHADWLQRVTSRVSIDARFKGGPWQPLPQFAFDPDLSKPFPEWGNTALQDMTHVRIVFPVPEQVF